MCVQCTVYTPGLSKAYQAYSVSHWCWALSADPPLVTCPKSDPYSACLGNMRVGPAPLFPPLRNDRNSTRDVLSMVHHYVFTLKAIICDYSRACFLLATLPQKNEADYQLWIPSLIPGISISHSGFAQAIFATFDMNESPTILTQCGLLCFPGCA